jgi:hypothetical protein
MSLSFAVIDKATRSFHSSPLVTTELTLSSRITEGGLRLKCDGDRFHPIEKLAEDMARQAVLERLGWKFIRIRGSQFFRDREQTWSTV